MHFKRRDFIKSLTAGTTGLALGNITGGCKTENINNLSVDIVDENIKNIFATFKAHWDIGFTTSARKLTHNIINWHFPTVIGTAKKIKDSRDHDLVLTYGSWIVQEGLNRLKGEKLTNLENAIANNVITWNAMPFTMHSEYYDRSLYEYCLEISQNLDKQFGKKTIAAKLTDVPCHTVNIVPLLADAGIKFLHIGVNWMCVSPDVPDIFIWKHDDGSEIIVMYDHSGYGRPQAMKEHDQMLGLKMKGDNMDPWTEAEVAYELDILSKQYPNAIIQGARIDEYAKTLTGLKNKLPVITKEFGDTWIFGTGSDPYKTAQFRELSRLRTQWIKENKLIPSKEYHTFSTNLMLVGEHTWGMDHNTYMDDRENYETEQFHKVKTRSNYRILEESWNEQREYIDNAIETLPAKLKSTAEKHLKNLIAKKPDLSGYIKTNGVNIKTTQLEIAFDSKGEITLLNKNGKSYLTNNKSLGSISYQTYNNKDFEKYGEQYYKFHWDGLDESSSGLEGSYAESKMWHTANTNIYQKEIGNKIYVIVESFFERDAIKKYGSPKVFYTEYIIDKNSSQIEINLQWFEKQACKLPESIWFSFIPDNKGEWKFSKIGSYISPNNVASKGSRNLHGINKDIVFEDDSGTLKIESLDANLVSPGKKSIIDFHNELPDFSKGVHFNLFNNLWQTNFVAWYENDARFRFKLDLA